MKKVIFLIFTLPLFLTGCWDKTEVDDLAMVTAIGIDLNDEDRYEVTLQIAKPNAFGKGENGSAEEKAYETVTNQGKTISEAMVRFYATSPRRVYWGHNKIVIFGRKISEKGINDALDWVQRVEGLRFSTYIFTTPDTAKEILKINYGIEKIPSLAIQSNIRLRYKYIAEFTPTMNIFIERMLSHNKVSFATNLGTKNNNLEILGMGIYKDGRLIEYFNNKQTQDIMRLFNRVKGGIILVPCKKNPEKYTSFEILDERATLTPEVNDEEITYHLTIEADGIISGTHCGEKIMTKEKIHQLESEVSKVIKRRVASIINFAQEELNVDILNYDEFLKKKKPGEWTKFEKNWDKIFPTIETKIVVNSSIKRSSWINDPIPNDKKKKKN